MTDREKLIELISVAEDKCDSIYDCDSCEYVLPGSCRKELIADYLLANGVIVPPCKVGDIVYVITVKRPCYACVLCTDFCHKSCSFDDRNKLEIKIARVCGIEKNGEINKVHLEIDKSKICHSYEYTCWFQDFGKTVFITKEEAEEKLKEREQNDR